MLAVAIVVVVLQSATVQIGGKTAQDSVRRARHRDSVRVAIDERQRDREKRAPIRIPLTPELERSAFVDSDARTILLRARAARFEVDSTLLSYDATAYQRVSAGIGFRAIGRNRLLFRSENASRVRWSRANGVMIDLKGARTAIPMAQGGGLKIDVEDDDFAGMSPIPWYPGREALWVGSGTARAEVDERELIHPIALGAEAYYRYESGDSVTITLPDGKGIRLRELRIIPRRPEWKLSVGSFWFDQDNGQLVRAVYRFAAPMNIWAVADEEIKREQDEDRAAGRPVDKDDEVPGWVKGMMTPMEANLEAVTIEYGLYGGRYWLPRTQYAEGYGRAGFIRVPVKIEESFKYASVNGIDSVPPTGAWAVGTVSALRDSLFGKDAPSFRDLPPEERRERERKLADAVAASRAARRAKREEDCRTLGYYTQIEDRNERAIRAQVRVPCDSKVLAQSPELPPSLYDEGEELFGVSDREELLKSLNFSLQPSWSPMPIQLTYGLGHSRFNRVEGLSSGIHATQVLGGGYSWDALARVGTADWVPGAELGIARSDGRTSWRVGAYRRLSVANSDWGSPLSFGSSLGALLYGRDEGFYYRSTGVQLERSTLRGGGRQVRFFLERESEAPWNTRFNVSRALGSASEFQPNILAERATIGGLAVRDQWSYGQDPLRWRLLGDLRLEGGYLLDRAKGDTASKAYVRAAGDLNVTRGFGPKFATSLTASAGYSDGAPIQRQFFLGGAQTVRGQLLGTMSGQTYWLGRAEFSRATGLVRPVLFGDVGWAGDWSQWRTPGRPMSGVGVGASVLDGLIRLDLSRGLYPRKANRLDLYVEARF
jgi:hypothetical protein